MSQELCPLTVSLNKSLSLALLPWVSVKLILGLCKQEPWHRQLKESGGHWKDFLAFSTYVVILHGVLSLWVPSFSLAFRVKKTLHQKTPRGVLNITFRSCQVVTPKLLTLLSLKISCRFPARTEMKYLWHY